MFSIDFLGLLSLNVAPILFLQTYFANKQTPLHTN